MINKRLDFISFEFYQNVKRLIACIGSLLFSVMTIVGEQSAVVFLQQENENTRRISGIVVDENGEGIIGATVLVKGRSDLGTITNVSGFFVLNVPAVTKSITVSFIGYQTQEIAISSQEKYQITLREETKVLDEVIVVGYGTQKKESVVGAISHARGEDLQRAAGVSNLGQALTGLLPGVSTIQVTGMPGDDDPEILIRAKTTWNNAQPLILVDGIERRMNDVDMNDVESVSVLKDASATAVFGVKGAEGVILITTKRGKEGKLQINFSTNMGSKFVSRLPQKMNSFDSYTYRNLGVEREVVAQSDSWNYYMPATILNHYKQPQSIEDSYLYPDVNWAEEMLKDYATSSNYNLNIGGGNQFAKYFTSLSYLEDNDILNTGMQVGLPYKTEYSYERYNYRINSDFNITSSTTLSVNLAGYLGMKNENNPNHESNIWEGLYRISSGVFPVKYEDGIWGFTALDPTIVNPVRRLNSTGTRTKNTSQMNTDFILKQKLDVITQGLSAQASFSYDTQMLSVSSVNGSSLLSKYIDPITGLTTYSPYKGNNEYDYVLTPERFNTESVSVGATVRRLFYQLQFNYGRKWGKHDVGLTALMNREQYASGSEFPHYREDWVGRVNYNYDEKYLFESNAAYNGSEKFGEGYRFGFFPSISFGWLASNERFLKPITWMDKIKIRYSIGKVGNDVFNSARWPYQTQWRLDDNGYPRFGENLQQSPYPQYVESSVGNPDLQWEVVVKQNLGLEFSVFKGKLSGTIDYFKDDRDHIFLSAERRTVMDYFGAAPVAANIGKTTASGYEFELKYRDKTSFDLRYWLSYSFTHSKDRIIYDESAPLLATYLKTEGFQIGQTKTQLSDGYMQSWDDVYASTGNDQNSNHRLPGDLIILDFNGDGIINSADKAPYGFPERPQNTYNIATGFDYKNLSFMIQFYGVFNTTIGYNFPTTTDKTIAPLVYQYLGNFWSLDNQNADWKAPRALTTSPSAELAYFDGSYLRLKNVELAYTFNKNWLKTLKIRELKLKINANNLLFWSQLPEDREKFVSFYANNAYPNLKRINIGLNVSF